ncbi:hypothetical protein SLA2020_401410 [Shorea laevis]
MWLYIYMGTVMEKLEGLTLIYDTYNNGWPCNSNSSSFLSVFLNHHKYIRVQTSFEHLSLDQQLRILNKPHVKSIKSEVGDIFDCVDIYNQPAFHHLLLKNHKIQMKPSYYPEGLMTSNSSISSSSAHPLKIGGYLTMKVALLVQFQSGGQVKKT